MDNRRPQPTRIVIADDHPIFRDGLRRLLETEPDLKVIGEACDGAEAVKLARSSSPTSCCWTSPCLAIPGWKRCGR